MNCVVILELACYFVCCIPTKSNIILQLHELAQITVGVIKITFTDVLYKLIILKLSV